MVSEKLDCSKLHLTWSEIYRGLIHVEVDGWKLALFNDCDTLDYCEFCRSPDGRMRTLELWQREGADPAEMLDTSSLERLEGLLCAI